MSRVEHMPSGIIDTNKVDQAQRGKIWVPEGVERAFHAAFVPIRFAGGAFGGGSLGDVTCAAGDLGTAARLCCK